MVKTQLFIAAALFVGVAIGYFLKPDAPADGNKASTGYVAASKIDDKGESASVKALRARIAELEKLLAEKDAEQPGAAVAAANPQKEEKEGRHGPPSMAEMRERMEKMKKENPEKFAEITSRMEKFRQHRMDRAHKKVEFLSSIDTSTMTDDQKKQHERYQELIARREDLESKMHNLEMTDEDREDIMRDMRETENAMRQAAKKERQTLIDQTAQALGFTGDDATAVSTTISDIISSTESGNGMPPPPDGGAQGDQPPGNR